MATADRTAPVDPAGVRIDNEYYEAVGDSWWDTSGPLRVLHDMNPTRLDYVDAVLSTRFGGRSADQVHVLDVGCGGGLISEGLARRGYRVTGVDISAGSVAAARRHAEAAGVDVDYQVGSAYELPVPDGSVDAVVMSDVLEHLHDLVLALGEAHRVLRPGGVLLFDTIDRTVRSYLMAILLAERLFRMVKPGTHDWRMFLRPAELARLLDTVGLTLAEVSGLAPARGLPRLLGTAVRESRLGPFRLCTDTSVSYIGHAVKDPRGNAGDPRHSQEG